MCAAPDLAVEHALVEAGCRWVAGVDEVGRGALAGPVAAAAVILPLRGGGDDGALLDRLSDVRDSKAMTAHGRTDAARVIEAQALDWAMGWASAPEIDALGIARATWLAMRRALHSLGRIPDAVVVDGRDIAPLGPWRQMSVVRGDASVLSVACASVVAKVRRDAYMVRLDEACPRYGLADHKGYGSSGHRTAIRTVGPCAAHRLTWRLTAELNADMVAERLAAKRPATGRSLA